MFYSNNQQKHKKKSPAWLLKEGFPTNNFLVGNYGLRRDERWEDMPSMSSEVGEIYCMQVCLWVSRYLLNTCVMAIVVTVVGVKYDLGRELPGETEQKQVTVNQSNIIS